MLSPKDSPAAMKDQTSMQLPKGKTIVDVFADFMRYLFNSTMDLFKVTERNGELKWDSISSNIELVLSHPNGWGGPQQVQLRTAAVRAGIVPDSPAGRSRVHFVTEGETSFYFCAGHTEAGKNLKVRHVAYAWCWFVDPLTAWRARFNHRCGWRDHRYQYLHSPQQPTTQD